jgi:Fic family protein
MSHQELSKKKQLLDEYRPLPKELVNNLGDWFRIELTYTSNAIEGNTLTRQETALVVEKGLTVGSKSLKEHLEATNHAAALNWINGLTKRKLSTITQQDILEIHKIILKGIDDENAGCYRNVAVRIAGSRVVMPNPRKVPDLMNNFIYWLHSKTKQHPVQIAALAHYKLVSIHPFIDGNGRTARLLMNLILMIYGYPPAIIRKQDRLVYINALEQAQLGGSLDNYLALIIKSVDRSLDIYLKAVSGTKELSKEKPGKLLKIGELAKKTGIPNSTIRHWTKEGLLEVAETTPFGYQLYAHEMIKRIKKIKELQAKRYTLSEIKNVI